MITDAGGLPIDGGGTIRRGALLRLAGGLVTEVDLARLAGVRLVIDLRGGGEDRGLLAKWAAAHGVRYEWLPIEVAGGHDLAGRLQDAAVAPTAMAELYAQLVDEHGHQVARAIALIAEDTPVAFGCAAGKDRTGVVAACLQVLLGASEEDVVRSYAVSAPPAERLRVLLADYGLDDGPVADVLLGAEEETMRATLARLRERHGSVEAYLVSNGLPAQVPERLRGSLITGR